MMESAEPRSTRNNLPMGIPGGGLIQEQETFSPTALAITLGEILTWFEESVESKQCTS